MQPKKEPATLEQFVLLEEGVLASGVATYTFITQGFSNLRVWWKVTNATGVGDLGATSVRAHDAENVVVAEDLTPESAGVATFAGSVAWLTEVYDVRGINKVTVSITNGHVVDARDLEVHVIQQ